MGEIFARPLPVRGLAFTGERLTSELAGQTAIEHLHRYMLAREFCRGRRVLDVASGEGYGSAMLAQVAESVVGVEIASDAVSHAAANYADPKLRFLQGDARAIPLADASVDVVVSFETIEHFDGQDGFVSEVHRVLRPGGLLIVSTPDRDTYSPADEPANPYHARELTREEFGALLGRRFANVAMCWQRTLAGSALLPGPGVAAAPEAFCFERRGDTHFEASAGFPRPQYLVALCSDAPVPAVPPSVYIDYGRLHAHEQGWLDKVNAERERCRALEEQAERGRAHREATEAALRAHIEAIEATLRTNVARAEQAESAYATEKARSDSIDTALRVAESRAAAAEQASELGTAIRQLQESSQQQIEALTARLAALTASTSWRVTAPLRRLRAMFAGRADR